MTIARAADIRNLKKPLKSLTNLRLHQLDLLGGETLFAKHLRQNTEGVVEIVWLLPVATRGRCHRRSSVLFLRLRRVGHTGFGKTLRP